MLILCNRNNTESSYLSINCKDFSVHYKIDAKELVFENSKLILFLKTNYSEEYIKSILRNSEKVNHEIIENGFQKDGFWTIVDKISCSISINRDLSGLGTCYYFRNKNELFISSNVHELGVLRSKKLNKKSVYQLLYFDFLLDGQTLYENVYQLKTGGKLLFDKEFKVTQEINNQPCLIENENKFTDQENITLLRKEIIEAHKNYINHKNIVFLSGGIDSVAMLIAINDLTLKENIINHSFKVKGTSQDETVYAQSIANHLDNELLIIERDFTNEITESIFRSQIVKMNNPYPGMWIFGNQISNKEGETYFAGQDTRLHTPSLNRLDEIAFNLFFFSKKGFKPFFLVLNLLLTPFKFLFNIALTLTSSTSKIFLGLRRALYLFDTRTYLNLVYFKLDKALIKSYKLPTHYFENIMQDYTLTLEQVTNKRTLYNTIVSKKWIEQYVNDMRYMVDMANSQGAKLAMPFYDMDLAKFSATIPFNLSTKTMVGKGQFNDTSTKVNKYVLREALIDKIDKKTYLRSKAVSRTGHLIFNQKLNPILKNIIYSDMETDLSMIREYNLEEFVFKFINREKDWQMTDDKFLLKIYYLVCIIIYRNRLIK